MSTMTKGIVNQIPATIGMLILISLIGSIGNLLVLIIYSQKREKSTANEFIKYLAISDCLVCTFIIPFTIYIEYNDWYITIDYICKAYYFLNNTSIPFGTLLITLVAIDRYLCICHPFLSLMTIQRSKICVLFFFLLSVMLGSVSVPQAKVINGTECVDYSRLVNATHYQKLFFEVVKKSQLVNYSMCIVVVFCLYTLIYIAVIKASRKRAKLKGLNTNYWFLLNRRISVFIARICCKSNVNSDLSNAEQFNNSNTDNSTNDELDNEVPCRNADKSLYQIETTKFTESAPVTKTTYVNPSNSGAVSNELKIKRKFKETILFQNFKTALMLLVVTITYILTFLPACLMVTETVDLYLPIFYMYYINNAANPIIYGFMNQNFREDVKTFLRKTIFRR